MPRALWNSLQKMPSMDFPANAFPSDYVLGKALSQEAKLDIKYIDCCINGCRAFTRSYSKDTGKARKQFLYFSPVNRLRAQSENKATSERLKYPQIRQVDPYKYQDIWEGDHIKNLKEKSITWGGKEVAGAGRYFEDDTQLALGLATDGLPCWKRSTRDELADRKLDMDSFLWPLIEDLRKLATAGVKARRWEGGRLVDYLMRAHLIVISGDMPAISKLMNFKSIGAIFPCRWCKMRAIRPGEAGQEYGKYYLTTKTANDTNNVKYNALPLRTHQEIMRDVEAIRSCRTKASQEILKKEKGINDQSVLSLVGSINFPWSFSADVMHILYENIMKELLGLWDGTYKASMITGTADGRLGQVPGERYVVSQAHWNQMDKEVSSSNATVPAEMARRLGSISKRGYWTAETYSYFLAHLGPIVMRGRLSKVYYDHFVDLSRITNIICKLEITNDEIAEIRSGLVEWVTQFESMERFGGWAKRQVVHNRKNPIEALNNRVLREEQVSIKKFIPDAK
ncbi:hypothetical protein QFC22_006547 [Naganishia vaughanmartiniae]|uniref:Uncharacterized protein n=1 Tax=Naganishia vaughanmartiniae TaxID=1424756 RepID=A0ACC2WHZ8_9TREE|nr:hypothetical protein QFC22_006547 [Naganishia vaughanmartiniae]